MEIPVLTRFIKGLKLFLESRRLRWLTIVFVIGAIFVLFMRAISGFLPTGTVIAVLGGVFPTFFLLATLVSLLGLQRFIANEESYKQSLILFIPWLVASVVVYVILFLIPALFSLIYFWIAFFGWIVFQAYLSSRTSLRYAESVEIQTRSKATSAIFGFMNILSYVIIIGAFLFFAITNLGPLVLEGVIWFAALGMLIAVGFNFLNGILIIRYRNKVTGDNLALLGLFIAFYVAYFEYNAMKPDTGATDLFSLIVDLGISVFFLLYAMSSVGLTLASRADLDTRLKISKEFAATLTFFLASGYMVVEAAFEATPFLALARAPDLIKLAIFPLVALLMALLLIRHAGRAPEPEPMPEDAPVIPEEVQVEEEPAEIEEEAIEPEEEYVEPLEEEILEEESPENEDFMDTTEDES